MYSYTHTHSHHTHIMAAKLPPLENRPALPSLEHLKSTSERLTTRLSNVGGSTYPAERAIFDAEMRGDIGVTSSGSSKGGRSLAFVECRAEFERELKSLGKPKRPARDIIGVADARQTIETKSTSRLWSERVHPQSSTYDTGKYEMGDGRFT